MPHRDPADIGGIQRSVQIWLYGDQTDAALEITGKFDEDDICYVLLKDGGDSLYITVKYDNRYSMSPNSYPSPRSFNR